MWAGQQMGVGRLDRGQGYGNIMCNIKYRTTKCTKTEYIITGCIITRKGKKNRGMIKSIQLRVERLVVPLVCE